MDHGAGLILTITASLVGGFIGGFAARKLRLPVIVGYLAAGIAIGPFTPGFTGDAKIAAELAEIGVILLMFGVGIHFSLRQLLSVRGVAVPGALGQIAVATGLGIGLAMWWGWGFGAGLVLGLALSVASTVVLLRALMENDTLDTVHGRVAVGWLIVEDLVTVLVLVLIPALAVALGGKPIEGDSGGSVLGSLVMALGKTGVFIAFMVFLGTRAFPWLLAQVARTDSRELFTLAVLAVALGVAVGASVLLGVSLALGAFLAGMVISESDQSHQASADALPMRDAFSVLFFVSVGMLFNPMFIFSAPGKVLAVVAVVVVGKALIAYLIVVLLGYPLRTALTVAIGLAQVGEFSFIVAELGRKLGLLPDAGYQLTLAAALISITLNPLLFRTLDPVEAWLMKQSWMAALLRRRTAADSTMPAVVAADSQELREYAVICGYGRIGSLVGELLESRGLPCLVIEQNQRQVDALRKRGVTAMFGDAANPELLAHAHLDRVKVMVIAIPDPLATRRIIEHARAINPELKIIARTHSEREWAYLREQVVEAVLGEREAALEMARATLTRLEVPASEVQDTLSALRIQREMDPLPNVP
ncbi:MAG: cation:proton antiporter [Actinomycetota bacterium]